MHHLNDAHNMLILICDHNACDTSIVLIVAIIAIIATIVLIVEAASERWQFRNNKCMHVPNTHA